MDVRQGKFVGVLDRKQVPSVKDFENVSLPKPETIVLPNGIPVYIIRMGDQDVCRIDVIFSDCGEFGLLWCMVTDVGIFS